MNESEQAESLTLTNILKSLNRDKITIFIAILIASLNSLSAEETNSIITEETREARALVSATEKVSISS